MGGWVGSGGMGSCSPSSLSWLYLFLPDMDHGHGHDMDDVCFLAIGGLGERVRQQPPNREIGFLSSSFSFRVVRASGRGEAAWAREGRHPERWASRELGWFRRVAFRADFLPTFADRRAGYNGFWPQSGDSRC